MPLVIWIIAGIFLVVWLLGAILGFIGQHFWWFLLAAAVLVAYNVISGRMK